METISDHNVRIVTYHLNFVLGNGTVTVPEHISQSKSVISMTTNSKGYAYKDNLCAFRCLAYHQNKDWSLLENQTQELFQKWVSFNKRQSKDINSNSKTFPGITLDQLVYSKNVSKSMSTYFLYKKMVLHKLFTNQNVNIQMTFT